MDKNAEENKEEKEVKLEMRRTVSWQDASGKELAQIREFEPSEPERHREEDGEQSESPCCTIM